MRTLRGRPRNISESGIVYLDSEGEDSEYSDSDVEPVFFPAAEFEFGEALDEFATADNADSDELDNEQDNANVNRGRFFQLIHALDSDEDSSDDDEHHDPRHLDAQRNRGVIQFFGGTVQVRHIVHENFTQLQQQQQQQQHNNNNNNNSEGGPAQNTEHPPVEQGRNGDSDESEGEPPSIRESGVLIRAQIEHGEENMSGALNHEIPEESPSSSASKQEEVKTGDGSPTASLVPYPDLPDYASAGEDEDDESLNPSLPPPYKSPEESPTRLSVKRKEPDSEGEEEELNSFEGTSRGRKRAVEMDNGGKLSEGEGEEEAEETCNPMVSDEECSETEEAFRGDRIGSTVYSERHVLKILMKWIEELPNYSIESLMKARENEEENEEEIEKIQRLDTELEEQMSLLWDMSSETDVMNFLVENKVFSFIRDTIDRSACHRLTEIALGILANVISEPSIIEDFTVHDSSIQLVEKVVDLCNKVTDVAVLIQVFSVLRRIVWYLRNVAPVKKWTNLLQSPNFLGCSNFIMSSSRNVLLLGNVVMLFFTLLDFLSPDSDEDTEESTLGEPETDSEHVNNQKSSNSSKIREDMAKNFEPFCQSEFVPSICEALKELMKDPKPPSSSRKLTSTREKRAEPGTSSGCPTDDRGPNADDVDIPIPDGHVQQAILKGISTLALLQKTPNGQDTLKRSSPQVIGTILKFHQTFANCTEAITRSDSLEYYSLTLHLLSFCHCSLDSVNQDAIITPISTASKLMCQEEKDKEVDMVIRVQLKDGVEFDSVSYIALVAHEYLAAIAERFGPESTLEARNCKSNERFFAVLDQVLEHFNGDEGAPGAGDTQKNEKTLEEDDILA